LEGVVDATLETLRTPQGTEQRLAKRSVASHCASSVRGADTSRLDLTPQSAGLHAISVGLSKTYPDDHEMLRHGMVLYESLFAWCKTHQTEGLN
jgi:hypothetical protein